MRSSTLLDFYEYTTLSLAVGHSGRAPKTEELSRWPVRSSTYIAAIKESHRKNNVNVYILILVSAHHARLPYPDETANLDILIMMESERD